MPQTVPELHELIGPVERLRHDPPLLQPEQDGIALCQWTLDEMRSGGEKRGIYGE